VPKVAICELTERPETLAGRRARVQRRENGNREAGGRDSTLRGIASCACEKILYKYLKELLVHKYLSWGCWLAAGGGVFPGAAGWLLAERSVH